MPDVLVRDVPEPVLEKLKAHALENQRSLQQELQRVLEAAASATQRERAILGARAIRERLIELGVQGGDSTADIREDRDTDHGHGR